MNQEFSPGDVVQLKSGGPLMTVINIADGGAVWCMWFPSSEKTERASFQAATLKNRNDTQRS